MQSSRFRLATVATEAGGRTDPASRNLLQVTEAARARSEPRALRPAAAQRWRARWHAMLAVAAQRALAATLVNDGAALVDGVDGAPPPAAELWAAAGPCDAF